MPANGIHPFWLGLKYIWKWYTHHTHVHSMMKWQIFALNGGAHWCTFAVVNNWSFVYLRMLLNIYWCGCGGGWLVGTIFFSSYSISRIAPLRHHRSLRSQFRKSCIALNGTSTWSVNWAAVVAPRWISFYRYNEIQTGIDSARCIRFSAFQSMKK